MGLDANTVIWLGVLIRMGDTISGQATNPLDNAPDEIYDQLEDEGEIQVAGLNFRKFYHADEPVGFGVELLNRGWRDDSKELNLVAINQEVQALIPRVREAFSVLKITVEPKVWLGTHL